MSTSVAPRPQPAAASKRYRTGAIVAGGPGGPGGPGGESEEEAARSASGPGAPNGVRTWLYRADRPPTRADVQEWPELCRDDGNLLWVDLTDPADETLAQVSRLLGIDPRAARITQRPQ